MVPDRKDKSMRRLASCLFLLILLLSFTSVGSAAEVQDRLKISPSAGYACTIRLYIVEPVSRWTDAYDNEFSFGFLDFGMVENIDADNGSTWMTTVGWNGTVAGYPDIQEDNIMVIAVLFNEASAPTDAYPPFGYWFNAHSVDAAAYSTPGVLGRDMATGPYTHTVFIEEGTETG